MDVVTIIEHVVNRWNAHDRVGHIALFRDDVVVDGPGGVHLTGHSGVGQFYDVWNEAFPDNKVETALVFGEDGRGLLEMHVTGTQTGTFHAPSGDIPPTGRTLNLRVAVVYHIRHDKVASAHVYFDQVELLTQLGVTPQPAGTAAGQP